MKDRLPFNDREQAELVAFLDGELRGDAARKIENRIIADPKVRAEAEALKKTWDLLDYLPQSEPSTHFTQQTLERLPSMGIGWLERMLPPPYRREVFLWSICLFLAFLSGFFGYRILAGKTIPGDTELIRELRMIENKRLYDRGLNLKYLQGLDQPDLFGPDPSDS